MRELSESYMQDVGFEDLSLNLENAADKLSRHRMINFACRMKSEECLDEMHSKLESHIVDEETLPVDLESSVFCYGLMAASALEGGGLDFFEALRAKMQSSGSLEYRLKVIDALGCYDDVDVLFELLDSVWKPTSELRFHPDEKFKVIQAIHSHTIQGVEATMNFMIKYKDEAWTGKSNFIEILLEQLSKRIFNEALRTKVIKSEFSNSNMFVLSIVRTFLLHFKL